MQNRVYWARFYLDKAGAVKKTDRSHFVIMIALSGSATECTA
jgi:restriction endonuclease Mrr